MSGDSDRRPVRSQFVRPHVSNPYLVLSSVYAYRMTGTELGFFLALILPVPKFAIVALLLLRRYSPAFCLATLLFIIYSAAQLVALTPRLEHKLRMLRRG